MLSLILGTLMLVIVIGAGIYAVKFARKKLITGGHNSVAE